jgi:hypothetical protein
MITKEEVIDILEFADKNIRFPINRIAEMYMEIKSINSVNKKQDEESKNCKHNKAVFGKVCMLKNYENTPCVGYKVCDFYDINTSEK